MGTHGEDCWSPLPLPLATPPGFSPVPDEKPVWATAPFQNFESDQYYEPCMQTLTALALAALGQRHSPASATTATTQASQLSETSRSSRDEKPLDTSELASSSRDGKTFGSGSTEDGEPEAAGRKALDSQLSLEEALQLQGATTLIVCGMTEHCGAETIIEAFAGCGCEPELNYLYLPRGKMKKSSHLGYCFVNLATPVAATKVVLALHDKEVAGGKLSLRRSATQGLAANLVRFRSVRVSPRAEPIRERAWPWVRVGGKLEALAPAEAVESLHLQDELKALIDQQAQRAEADAKPRDSGEQRACFAPPDQREDPYHGDRAHRYEARDSRQAYPPSDYSYGSDRPREYDSRQAYPQTDYAYPSSRPRGYDTRSRDAHDWENQYRRGGDWDSHYPRDGYDRHSAAPRPGRDRARRAAAPSHSDWKAQRYPELDARAQAMEFHRQEMERHRAAYAHWSDEARRNVAGHASGKDWK